MKGDRLFWILGLTALLGLIGYAYLRWRISPEHVQKLKEEAWYRVIHEFSPELQTGDIIFQTSNSSQSKAIQLATHSKYSHCGIIYKEAGDFFIFEAVQPVKKTLLRKWIARGEEEHYVIKRLKNAEEVLTKEVLERMKKIGDSFSGKAYDIYFGWSDEKIYCSELIWKIYKRATGLEIGKLQKLRDFDLTNNVVKKIMQERYGNNIPQEEIVISPASIFDSDLLLTVKSN